MIDNYLDLIQAQRIKNPNFPKDYRLIYLPTKLKEFNFNEEYQKLISYPNVKFTNVVYRTTPLYKNIKDNYYYEFVDIGVGYNTTLEDWKYFYIPLNKGDLLLNTNLLPFYKYYNTNNSLLQKQYPIFQILIPFIKLNNYFYNTPLTINKHPLSPIFQFTGYRYLNKEGLMLYEYIDSSLYNDDDTITYYSLIRPLNFYNSSSIANKYTLTVDTRLNSFKDSPPESLEIYVDNLDNLDDLRFTGNTTTSNFNSNKKWYEYTIYKLGQPFNKVLLPYAPTNLSLDFVRLQLNYTDIGFKYNNVYNKQYISLNQVSSDNIINLS